MSELVNPLGPPPPPPTAGSTRTPRRPKAQATRRRILDAARGLFVERGYVATTIEAIAAEAGVAVPTVYLAFGTKRALLVELLDIAAVGDEEPVALLERPWVDEIRHDPDPESQQRRSRGSPVGGRPQRRPRRPRHRRPGAPLQDPDPARPPLLRRRAGRQRWPARRARPPAGHRHRLRPAQPRTLPAAGHRAGLGARGLGAVGGRHAGRTAPARTLNRNPSSPTWPPLDQTRLPAPSPELGGERNRTDCREIPHTSARAHHGLRPTPPKASSSAGRPPLVSAGSGRHRGHDSTPGSTSSRPSKKPAICSGLRRMYGTAPLWL